MQKYVTKRKPLPIGAPVQDSTGQDSTGLDSTGQGSLTSTDSVGRLIASPQRGASGEKPNRGLTVITVMLARQQPISPRTPERQISPPLVARSRTRSANPAAVRLLDQRSADVTPRSANSPNSLKPWTRFDDELPLRRWWCVPSLPKPRSERCGRHGRRHVVLRSPGASV
jgi:hypothetical protein